MALAFYDGDNENETDDSAANVLKTGARRLIGLGCLALGLFLIVMLGTYSPDDPSGLNHSETAPTNALGYMGAYLAAPLVQILGAAAWVLPAISVVWAVRFLGNFGAERALARIVFLPIALMLCAIFASTLVPFPSWTLDIGLGGVGGDGLLSAILGLMPFSLGVSLFIATIVFGLAAAAMFAFVAGATLVGIVSWVFKVVSDVKIAGVWVLGLMRATVSGVAGKTGEVAAAFKTQSEASTAADTPRDEAPQNAKPSKLGRRSENGPLSIKALSLFNAGSSAPAPIDDTPPYSAPSWADDETEPQKPSRIADIVARKADKHQKIMSGYGRENGDDVMETEAAAPTRHEYNDAPSEQPVSQKSEPQKTAPARQEAAPVGDMQNPTFAAYNDYEAPPLALLQNPETIDRVVPSREFLSEKARLLESVLEDYGVKGEITAVKPGPVVTMYELEPAAGLKASRVIGLADDIARSMSALTARVSTVPGRSVIGIELPNENRETVLLREIFSSQTYGDTRLPLPLALGKDIAGEPTVANLAKMPHLLIAGTTGSGKSVAINTMILSLLYHLTPEECRLIMIDPKMLELSVYDGIPHLLSPVVTDPKKAVVALKWVVSEMEERYRKMSKMGVRNVDGYNARVKDALAKGEGFQRTVQTGFDDDTGEPIFETEEITPEAMPYIVVIVDEMADLMMVAGKEIEACIQRLAQMARASGIHLIMATQRPSVDVITGTIKANFPTRISFQVTSKIDSRTILGEMGAEQLLGQGDMLYMAGGGRVTRVHAPFVSDEEVEDVVRHLKAQGEPTYVSGVQEGPEEEKAQDIDAVLGLGSGNGDAEDQLYDEAVMIAARDRKCSTSYIQRKLAIGYNKAARLVERMEDEGVVSAANHVGKRDVLVPEVN